MGNGYWDSGQHQKTAVILFKHDLPVHIVTEDDNWINGWIKEYSGDSILVFDRHDGFRLIKFVDIQILEQFRGEFSSLKRWVND